MKLGGLLARGLALMALLSGMIAAFAADGLAADGSSDVLCVQVENRSDYVLGVERMSGAWEGANPSTVLRPGESGAACVRLMPGQEADLHWGAPFGVRIALVARAGGEPPFFAVPVGTPIFNARVERIVEPASGQRGGGGGGPAVVASSPGWRCVFTHSAKED